MNQGLTKEGFMEDFVDQIFRTKHQISVEDKEEFGKMCTDHEGRIKFALEMNNRRREQFVEEETFHKLTQTYIISGLDRFSLTFFLKKS